MESLFSSNRLRSTCRRSSTLVQYPTKIILTSKSNLIRRIQNHSCFLNISRKSVYCGRAQYFALPPSLTKTAVAQWKIDIACFQSMGREFALPILSQHLSCLSKSPKIFSSLTFLGDTTFPPWLTMIRQIVFQYHFGRVPYTLTNSVTVQFSWKRYIFFIISD